MLDTHPTQQTPQPGSASYERMKAVDAHRESRTLLDTRETIDGENAIALYDRLKSSDDSCVSFRHREHHWHRTRVLRAFERIEVDGTRSHAYASCGSNAWLMQSESDPSRFGLRSSTCHDRWCPACAKTRANVIRSNLDPLVEGKELRLITLTLKHNGDALTDRLDRLLNRFALLRKLKIWKESVFGGASFLEVKINADTMRWHPHLHIIATGSYIPLQRLRAAWLACTGDSHIVDIRIIKDPRKIASYVTKYVTKPADNDLYRIPAALAEAIQAMKGRRLVATFGSWRATALLRYESKDEWHPILEWPEFLERCNRGNQFCIRAMNSLTKYDFDANEPTPANPRSVEWEP